LKLSPLGLAQWAKTLARRIYKRVEIINTSPQPMDAIARAESTKELKSGKHDVLHPIDPSEQNLQKS